MKYLKTQLLKHISVITVRKLLHWSGDLWNICKWMHVSTFSFPFLENIHLRDVKLVNANFPIPLDWRQLAWRTENCKHFEHCGEKAHHTNDNILQCSECEIYSKCFMDKEHLTIFLSAKSWERWDMKFDELIGPELAKQIGK